MPNYDLILLLQKMNQPSLKSALKRTAQYVFEIGGTLRKLENLGFQQTPFKVEAKGRGLFKEAHYFRMNFDSAPEELPALKDKFQRDTEVVRATTILVHNTLMKEYEGRKNPECTLHLDLLPPPYRPGVVELQNKVHHTRARLEKKKFRIENDLGHDPF